ncbi:MAG: hypothetical protein EXQ82_03255 [Pseudolabrys sp.]|nr:hypothetical protein [Pseudolabrys sp.]
MDDGDVSDQIALLEDRIERLSESIERCGKIAVGAKIAIAAGSVWFALALIRIFPFNPTAFVAATTAVLGGVVLLGSNSTTWTQMDTELHTAEAARADLIGGIELRVVGENVRTVH